MLKISPRQFAQKFPLRYAQVVGVYCAYCNTVFFPYNKRGPVPRYCSRSCQSKVARRAAVLVAVEGSQTR